MESSQPIPIPTQSRGPQSSSRSRSSKLDDVASLTSFNPFSEEDENDQSSYALVASLFTKVKDALTVPLSTVTTSPNPVTTTTYPSQNGTVTTDQRRPSMHYSGSNNSNKSSTDRPTSLTVNPSNLAPPLMSLTPVSIEAPFLLDSDRASPSSASYYPQDAVDGGGYAIPGFPIQDSDARSIRTTNSVKRSASVSKVIRRVRGEGLSREYWMDDALCKECYDCKSVFTAWRRKHHCRICGQIYCSRCASNIIKAARFGHDGMIRICNLCLEKLAKVDDEDDDDRRSVSSSVAASFPAHQLGGDSRSFGRMPQSPFAASQLLGRSDSFSLFSIAETTKRPYSGSEDSGWISRPLTPGDDLRDDRRYSYPHAVPFRRTVTEDEKFPVAGSDRFGQVHSPTGPGSKTPIDFPVTIPVSMDGSMSSVAFPMSSPDQNGFDTPGMPRSRHNSYADFDGVSFIRSRVQSRLDIEIGEPGWRMRRESTAYAQELNTISMFHLRVMLRQMLTSETIPNIKEWEETLLKLALRIARELTFTAHPHRQGADMDVRRYVKIKKIPGGSPQDSEYVDGAVITKNVAHKKMSRDLTNPRIMLVTFPLEFHRIEGQYMHFRQIFPQEKEYLGNLAGRIAALRPHVVLAEKSVSRLALEALAGREIAVARAVKPSAISFVSRMTQGDVFSSIDKLALEPRLGHCSKFRVQTFDHPLIPGRRKTYMRFEGCNREMGCTIILRGGDIDVLKKIKKVTRFMSFIVRNLRLETHLWKDSVITLPVLTTLAIPLPASPNPFSGDMEDSQKTPPPPSITPLRITPTPSQDPETSDTSTLDRTMDDLPDEDAEQLRLSRRIQESLDPYQKTFISVSATLRFPAPYPIRRMKELDDELRRVKREWEDDLVRREERQPSGHQQEETVTQASTPVVQHSSDPADEQADIAAQIESLQIPSIPPTPTPGRGPLDPHPGYFDLPKSTSIALPGGILVASPMPCTPLEPEAEPTSLRNVEDIALESRLSLVKCHHEEQRRIWEWYLRKNSDDFDVEKYQCITLWEFTMPIEGYGVRRACFPPAFRYITFYGENDYTLGQFIENSVMDTLVQFLDPKAVCDGKGCGLPTARHCRIYVHNETRLFVAVEQWDGQITGNAHYASPDAIITWSICRECGSATPFIPVSPEMQRYSFAKFLELHFYPADVQLVQGAGCQHNIYRHHIRYFAIKGMTVRFQADPVVLHEVVYPPMRIRVRPETQLDIKNRDFERLHQRNTMWYSALIDDLKLINIDAATGDEQTDAALTAQINWLISRAEREKNEVTRSINQIYKETAPTDTLALNLVRAKRQDLIVAWQQDFDRLPKPRMPPLLDKNSRRPSAFGSVRAMWPRRYDTYDIHVPSSSVSEAEEAGVLPRRVTGDSLASTSSASEASEAEPVTGELDLGAQSEAEAGPGPSSVPQPSTDVAQKSDQESDSTIGAASVEKPRIEDSPLSIQDEEPAAETKTDATIVGPLPLEGAERPSRIVSRLPRRPSHYPSVAELVKRYQDYLPPQGVEDLAKTALAPAVPVSESEQEGAASTSYRPRVRSKQYQLSKKSSTSDFEQGYAANAAPKYLNYSRRPSVAIGVSSRIPGPQIPVAVESHSSSRRSSPDKRPMYSRIHSESTVRAGRTSPPPFGKPSPAGPFMPKASRVRSASRATMREKAPSVRQTGSQGGKNTLRRPTRPGTVVSNMTRHFERINERSNRRYAVIRGKRARPVTSARPKLEILDSIKDMINDESESSDSSEADDEGGDDDEAPEAEQKPTSGTPSITLEPPTDVAPEAGPSQTAEVVEQLPPTTEEVKQEQTQVTSVPAEPKPLPFTPSIPPSPAIFPSQLAAMTPSPPDLDIGTERNSILKALSGFWQPFPPPRYPEGEDPLSDPEHIFRDLSMVVRTDEPTSVIALALNSQKYRDLLMKSRAEKRLAREPKLMDGVEAFPDDGSVAESTSTWGVVNVDSVDGADPTEELRAPSSKLPWAISFESGGLTISCTVLYPEQFDALRRTYDCEKSMVESLARCVKWDASGGKSGSAFLKTLDDRFIAKELSRAELQAMETFAPSYFDYMSSAVVANRPTLLAKIFGCYKITFKKTQKDRGYKSKSFQMNLLVMENLFYDRQFNKIYDLKGSTRNRHVPDTSAVLLDENLVQTAHLAPFYLREHSKRILRGALYNDSKFLADLNVMDYSLVAGYDNKTNELVVGIVDYIRTYTLDKKLENWVKDSGFLGGANKGEPTIVGPKQYRQRFLSAMERYFPLIPDRWMKQHDAPEEEGNNLLDLWPDW